MLKKSAYFPFQTKLLPPMFTNPFGEKNLEKRFQYVAAIVSIAYFDIAFIVFWLCQGSTLYGRVTYSHYCFIMLGQFGVASLSISEVFFKYLYPTCMYFIFQLQCTMQTYCLIYCIFIKVLSEVGVTLGHLL